MLNVFLKVIFLRKLTNITKDSWFKRLEERKKATDSKSGKNFCLARSNDTFTYKLLSSRAYAKRRSTIGKLVGSFIHF